MLFKNKLVGMAISALVLNLGTVTIAQAASADVRCERRASPPRSKISVDGRGLLAGLYRAKATTANGSVWSRNVLRSAAGEAEFDFDSNAADIAAGATAIPPTLIGPGANTAYGRVYRVTRNSVGGLVYTLSAMGSKTCTVK